MELEWRREQLPTWNEDKKRIIGARPEIFPTLAAADEGAVMPGDWWRVERGDRIVGYGWMDVTWGDAEVLLAVDPSHRGQGIGSFILERLAGEAHRQGLRYLYNVIPEQHPAPEGLQRWLEERGFGLSGDGLLKRQS